METKGFHTIADEQVEYVGSTEAKCESVGVGLLAPRTRAPGR